jgi:type VI secretion system protein ImpH
MAGSQRGPDPSLIWRLLREPYRFDFFQAVRLLEWTEPGRVPVGHDGPYRDEVARFAQHLTLNFPASAIHTFENAPEPNAAAAGHGEAVAIPGGEPLRMVTSFMGLIGPWSALPTVYTERLIGLKERNRRPAVDFLNLFHHRLVSFFYRAWEKYSLTTLWQKKRAGDQPAPVAIDPLSRQLFHLIGLGETSQRGRHTFPDASLLFYTGIFSQQHRSALMLERLLADYLGQRVTVLSFSGQWLRLTPEERSRMGTTGRFNRLGTDVVVGRRVWDLQSKFRVRIGPLGFADFWDFLPGGPTADRLMDLVRFYIRSELDFDVQLVLRKEEVPASRLSSDPAQAAQLSRASWLKVRDFTRDADEAVFRPPASP